jgi:hypothetical protein
MVANTPQPPLKPNPPARMSATAPPGFARPEMPTGLQKGAKKLFRLIFRRK